MLNQNPKSPGALINQLTNARTAANGKQIAVPKPVIAQPDLSNLPPIERLTAARKLAAKHKLAADNPAPIAPVKSAKSWWPEPDERTKRIKAMVAEMEAATKNSDGN